jgi:ABC-type multidrug transport system fused ATPase/permease subunit
VESVIAELHLLEGLQRHRTDVSHGRLPTSEIELRDVGFRYEGTSTDVLRGVSLTISPGEEVGIVGATGAGKTTLLGIILGLLDASTGEMRIGGRPVSECRTDWQLSIGYVPQEILVIDDSIRANIVFGIVSAEVDEDRVSRVVRAAQLESFVAALPDGLDTRAGEAGVRLSGGQRQRLGLARALYQQPSVLVLDEATSAIDAETESRIVAAIAEHDRSMTIITVSHRLSTLQHSDRIYFLRESGVAAVGTFDELNSSEPDFAQLVALAQLTVGTTQDTDPDNGLDGDPVIESPPLQPSSVD